MAEKLYYSMGEVADMLDVAPSLLRFWEKRFDCISPHKNKKGNRLFTPRDVRNLKTIYHLVKERGMTLAGAEKQLKARRAETERDVEIAERLAAIRALLVEVRNELGGDGVIVDDTVTEEIAAVKIVETAVEPPVPEGEQAAEAQPKPEPEQEPEHEHEHEPQAEQKPTPQYVEQTLF